VQNYKNNTNLQTCQFVNQGKRTKLKVNICSINNSDDESFLRYIHFAKVSKFGKVESCIVISQGTVLMLF